MKKCLRMELLTVVDEHSVWDFYKGVKCECDVQLVFPRIVFIAIVIASTAMSNMMTK